MANHEEHERREGWATKASMYTSYKKLFVPSILRVLRVLRGYPSSCPSPLEIHLYSELHQPGRQHGLRVLPLWPVPLVECQHGTCIQDVERVERRLHAGSADAERPRQPHGDLIVPTFR